ncbi:hypothetical protein QJQ45_008675 [Haematococcus lacustris]|nr:hypothetical protein QJQ45_008675 [Haematococcus lacustris]
MMQSLRLPPGVQQCAAAAARSEISLRRPVASRVGLVSRLFAMASPSYGPKWWTDKTTAVVTGANKGIGLEIARILAGQGLHTILTARNSPSSSVEFQQLDISDPASISHFAQWLKDQHGSLTLLVNNAGMAYKGDVFGLPEATATLATNYFGTVQLTEALLPMMPDHQGRVVTVSSRAGLTSIIRDPNLRQRFSSARTTAEVDALAQEFLAAVQRPELLAPQGWPRSMYGVSKLCLSTYCRTLAARMEQRGITVNACCPGWCRTDMSSQGGNKSAAEGADTPLISYPVNGCENLLLKSSVRRWMSGNSSLYFLRGLRDCFSPWPVAERLKVEAKTKKLSMKLLGLLTEALLPMMPDHQGRVVTVSSRAGLTSIIRDPNLRQRFSSARTTAEVDALAQEFLAAVQRPELLAPQGWPRSMYGVSKLCLSTYCRTLAARMEQRGITVNACCPGWCRTDMSSQGGNKSAAEGADTPVWLALRSPDSTGGLWGERRQLAY